MTIFAIRISSIDDTLMGAKMSAGDKLVRWGRLKGHDAKVSLATVGSFGIYRLIYGAENVAARKITKYGKSRALGSDENIQLSEIREIDDNDKKQDGCGKTARARCDEQYFYIVDRADLLKTYGTPTIKIAGNTMIYMTLDEAISADRERSNSQAAGAQVLHQPLLSGFGRSY
jgi:hypothetical protein